MLNTRLPGGFSWVGLVVTLAAIVLLVVFLYPIFGTDPRNEGQRTAQCQRNQRQIAIAALIYAQEHSETLPGTNWVFDLKMVTPESEGMSVLKCPTLFGKRKDLYSNPVCYGYNGMLVKADGTGVKLDQIIDDPTSIILFADAEPSTPMSAPGLLNGFPGRSDNAVTYSFRHVGNQLVAVFIDGRVGTIHNPADPKAKGDETRILSTYPVNSALIYNFTAGITGSINTHAPVAPSSVSGDYSTRPLLGAAAWLQNMKATAESENRVTVGDFAGSTAESMDDDSMICGNASGIPGPGAVALARDAVVIISHAYAKSMTSEEVKSTWGGKQSKNIYTYNRNSGTRAFFYRKIGLPDDFKDNKATVVENDYEMVQKIAADPDGIGYCSAAFLRKSDVNVVTVDKQTVPTDKSQWPEKAPTGSYPYLRTLYALPSENPSAGARDFMEKLPVLLKAVQQGPLFRMSYFLP